MPLDVGQLVAFDLPVNVTTLEPNTECVFTAEMYEGHPTTLYLIIACSEETTEHQHLDGPGSSCVFRNGQYGCRWVGDHHEDGHLKAVALELTRIK
ncbi:MAG: hypothetical protein HQ582_31130 [Planctomycetes bacterium]|nr:hypothetical protein [Planctomycetota bacterium]